MTEDKTKKIYKAIPPFNDCHCHGHANYFLDTTYETQEEVDLIKNVLNNYIGKK
jgi:hypothetical protein